MEIKHRYQLNQLLPPNPVTVELGCAEGLFSRDILRDWNPKLHYLVDIWETVNLPGDVSSGKAWHDANYQNVLKLVEPFKSHKILRGLTVDMAKHVPDDSVALVYIDACHSYECVKADINAWWGKVKVGGIMAWHDFMMPQYGVNRAVWEFANSKGLQVNDIPENEKKDAGAWVKKIA